MTNLSKFHIVFSSSILIRLNKDTFKGHLYQAVNNFCETELVEPHGSFDKEAVRNTRVSCVPTFDEPSSTTLHPPNLIIVVLLVWVLFWLCI